MDVTEAEYIKERWQEYKGELYKEDFYDPDHQISRNVKSSGP